MITVNVAFKYEKGELTENVCKMNKTAKPEFPAQFTEEEFNDHLGTSRNWT